MVEQKEGDLRGIWEEDSGSSPLAGRSLVAEREEPWVRGTHPDSQPTVPALCDLLWLQFLSVSHVLYLGQRVKIQEHAPSLYVLTYQWLCPSPACLPMPSEASLQIVCPTV